MNTNTLFIIIKKINDVFLLQHRKGINNSQLLYNFHFNLFLTTILPITHMDTVFKRICVKQYLYIKYLPKCGYCLSSLHVLQVLCPSIFVYQ